MHEIAELQFETDEFRVWAETGGPIMLKSVTPSGDPVELNSDEAKRLAEILTRLAAWCDEE